MTTHLKRRHILQYSCPGGIAKAFDKFIHHALVSGDLSLTRYFLGTFWITSIVKVATAIIHADG